jgi:ABC-type lipoprotein release transport system permease subunit
MLIFLVGALLGLIMGGALCVRYIRREVTDDIGPKLRRVQIQLDNIESAVNLAIMTRYTELSTRLPSDSAGQLPSSASHPAP